MESTNYQRSGTSPTIQVGYTVLGRTIGPEQGEQARAKPSDGQGANLAFYSFFSTPAVCLAVEY